MNIRECKQCGKMVDFDEPWCDHETMEESGLLDMQRRIVQDATNIVIDDLVHQAAKELGWHAGETWKAQFQELADSGAKDGVPGKEKHLSDLAHVYQHRGQDGKS